MSNLFRRVSRQNASYLCIRNDAGGYFISEVMAAGQFRRLPANQSKAAELHGKTDSDFAALVKNELDAAQRRGDMRLLMTK